MPSAPVCIMENEAGSEYLFKKCLRKPLLQGDLSHHGVKEKYQPLYQKLVLNMANLVNYDTGDDAPYRVQQRLHLHPDAYRAIMALLLVYSTRKRVTIIPQVKTTEIIGLPENLYQNLP